MRLPAKLTSHRYDCHHQLEDAVDERECEHDFQLSRAEGQLDNGTAQLRVLETRLQCDGSTSEQRRDLGFVDAEVVSAFIQFN